MRIFITIRLIVLGADEDVDGALLIEEIVKNHEIFVGSEATDYGQHLENLHKFEDEL